MIPTAQKPPPKATTTGDFGNPLGRRDVARVLALSAAVALFLTWLASRADIVFADGLRYIAQAQALSHGSWREGLSQAVDHPSYPLAIAATHAVLGGDSPEGWQRAAQAASIAAAVLLVVPIYLLSRELAGSRLALASSALFFALPMAGHVFADALSESTFLLYWTWGLWAAIRFLRSGRLAWIPLVVACSGLAYMTRPEGLLLPAALVATLGLSPSWVLGGLGRRGVVAVAVTLVGSLSVVGPYVAMKGGLGTKPSVARLIGAAPTSAAHAVERARPLDPDQTLAKTYGMAVKAVWKANVEAMTWPLVILAGLGLAWRTRREDDARPWRLFGVIAVASALALVRLHATGGYCSPRHAMILLLMGVPLAAIGLGELTRRLALQVSIPPRGMAALGTMAVAGWVAWNASSLAAPLNEGLGGYRDAGHWLAQHAENGERVVDVTGWSQFYGGRQGFTFANLIEAPSDPSARWVVVREAHLIGPWEYCERLRGLAAGREPVQVFAHPTRERPTRVLVFDRHQVMEAHRDNPTAAIRR